MDLGREREGKRERGRDGKRETLFLEPQLDFQIVEGLLLFFRP